MSTDINYIDMSDEELEQAPAPTGGLEFDTTPSEALEANEDEEFSSPDGTFEGALDARTSETQEPEAGEGGEEPGEANGDEGTVDGEQEEEDPKAAAAASPDDEETGSPKDPTTPDQSTAKPEDTPDDAAPEDRTTENPKGGDEAKTGEDESTPGSDHAVDAASNYAKIMAPFKANGKQFTPKDPDEVIRLMQMGANYSRKMQALKPNLRMMRMLENKGLLDEEKLNYLIDLNDKNPKAIQKLLHESKIDPIDLDTAETPDYKPTNHSVSDEQFAYQETLNDIASTSAGQATVQAIAGWDMASRKATFQDPKIMSVIHEQREAGIYDQIVDELERQKMLGNFLDVPFINAYKAVGDYLHERGELKVATQEPETPAGNVAPQNNAPREMVETRTAPPKAALKNGDRVSGTTPPRSSPSPAKTPQKSVYEMTDEEIMAMPLP